MRDSTIEPVEENFINSRSLAILDDMFFRLPFPDVMRMEKLLDSAGVSADAAYFLKMMQEDLDNPRAISDLRTTWWWFLDTQRTETGAAGLNRNPSRASLEARRERNRTPSSSEDRDDQDEVCSPRFMMISIRICMW